MPYMGNPNVWTPSRFAPNSLTNSFLAPTNFMLSPNFSVYSPTYSNPFSIQPFFNNPYAPMFNPAISPWPAWTMPVGGQVPFGPGNNFAFPMGAPFNGLPGLGLRSGLAAEVAG